MSSFISYELHHKDGVRVKLMGKRIGAIVREQGGWRYYPNGSKVGGEIFKALAACKNSLEAE